jgi:hypothetical protein
MSEWSNFRLLTTFSLSVAAIIAFLVLGYLVSNNKLGPPHKKPATIFVGIISVALALLIVGGTMTVMGRTAYVAVDKAGWFPHQRTLTVWMPHDWLVGEYKQCVLGGYTQPPVLNCGDTKHAPYEMDVLFHGSLEFASAQKRTYWRCQRKQESISCRATEDFVPVRLPDF